MRDSLVSEVEILYPEEPKCATILLLDTSGSMMGEKIEALNEGIKVLKEELSNDELARKRVEIAILTFGKVVNIVNEFCSVEDFSPPILMPEGVTPMGEAIKKGIELIESRKKEYRNRGIDYYRPWIFLITDGEPTDMVPGDELWNEIINKIHTGENEKKFLFFAIGVGEVNMDILKLLSPPNRPPVKLKGLAFKELFQWLSKSQSKVSASKVTDKIALPSIEGWAEI